MVQEIIFHKTGNFWIDNGIVGLYRILLRLQEEDKINDIGINLTSKALILSVSNSYTDANQTNLFVNSESFNRDNNLKPILEVLNESRKLVVSNYLTSTKNFGWIYKNSSFSEYQKTDFRMYLKPFFVGKTGKPEGTLNMPTGKALLKLLQANNIKIQVYQDKKTVEILDFKLQSIEDNKGNKPNISFSIKDESIEKQDTEKNRVMTSDEFIKFIQFISENHKKTLPDGKTKFEIKGKGYLNNPPKYEIGSEVTSNFFTKSEKKICFFSGEKLTLIGKVTGMDYPFLTGDTGEINFASYLDSKPSISAKFSFIALFSFYNLHYLLQDDFKNYFILYEGNLKELERFYNGIQSSLEQVKNAEYSNFENYFIGSQFEHETLFSFIISIFQQVQKRMDRDLRRGMLGKSIFTFNNDGNIFRNVKEYTLLESMFGLLEDFLKEGMLENFLSFIRNFQKVISKKGKKYDTTYRNKLCGSILNFQSIHPIVEKYLSEVKMKEEKPFPVLKLDRIISIFNLKLSNMDNAMVDLCKSVGNRIGRYCREKDDKGILFSIRNARNRIDFLKVLSESQFRTEVLYSEDFFDRLPDTPQWEEYKSLVSIFAMNSYLSKFIKPEETQI